MSKSKTSSFIRVLECKLPYSRYTDIHLNLFLQRASFKFKNVVRAAFKKHDNDELKLYLY
jgi:hypothetical protein